MATNMIPRLVKAEFGYEGTIKLESWAGFQSRNGGYGSISSSTDSDGSCRLATGGDMADNNPEIKDFHIKAYEFTIKNQELIKNMILEYLLKEYKGLQAEYGYDDEKEQYMPDVSDINGFTKLIGLSNVHLLNVQKEGVGYVGYEFGCTWDEEHGFGVMTHKDRIVSFGGADSSFLTWIARKDMQPIENLTNDSESEEIDTPNKAEIKGDRKPWWKFWK